MNMPGLPLCRIKPRTSVPTGKLPHRGLQVAKDGLSQGVGPAAGLIECQQGDAAFEDFQFHRGWRGCLHGWVFLPHRARACWAGGETIGAVVVPPDMEIIMVVGRDGKCVRSL